jgi:hypothetical protein
MSDPRRLHELLRRHAELQDKVKDGDRFPGIEAAWRDWRDACVMYVLHDAAALAARVTQLEGALASLMAYPRWLSIGSIDNEAEIRVSRATFEAARAALAGVPAPGEQAG